MLVAWLVERRGKQRAAGSISWQAPCLESGQNAPGLLPASCPCHAVCLVYGVGATQQRLPCLALLNGRPSWWHLRPPQLLPCAPALPPALLAGGQRLPAALLPAAWRVPARAAAAHAAGVHCGAHPRACRCVKGGPVGGWGHALCDASLRRGHCIEGSICVPRPSAPLPVISPYSFLGEQRSPIPARPPPAEGSCMAAFEWNAGGEWGGKPWSAELPTDSALVFYLFACYLAAPQWLFPVEVGRAGGTNCAWTLHAAPPCVPGYWALHAAAVCGHAGCSMSSARSSPRLAGPSPAPQCAAVSAAGPASARCPQTSFTCPIHRLVAPWSAP